MTTEGKQFFKKAMAGVLVVLVAAVFAIYVWPTAWYHPRGQVVVGTQVLPVETRVSRFTGKVQALTIEGWKDPVPIAVPADTASLPAPEKK